MVGVCLYVFSAIDLLGLGWRYGVIHCFAQSAFLYATVKISSYQLSQAEAHLTEMFSRITNQCSSLTSFLFWLAA
jgi:hypothetical protein